MYKQMLKVIGVVIFSYIVLYLMVIYVVIPRTQLKMNGQTVRERIQHNEKQVKFQNTVIDAKNLTSRSMASFNDIDLHHQAETVDFTHLTETVKKKSKN